MLNRTEHTLLCELVFLILQDVFANEESKVGMFLFFFCCNCAWWELFCFVQSVFNCYILGFNVEYLNQSHCSVRCKIYPFSCELSVS